MLNKGPTSGSRYARSQVSTGTCLNRRAMVAVALCRSNSLGSSVKGWTSVSSRSRKRGGGTCGVVEGAGVVEVGKVEAMGVVEVVVGSRVVEAVSDGAVVGVGVEGFSKGSSLAR